MDAETRKGFSDYLTDQRVLSEYSELLFAVQENSEVTRTNKSSASSIEPIAVILKPAST